jgi:hypothetical protein
MKEKRKPDSILDAYRPSISPIVMSTLSGMASVSKPSEEDQATAKKDEVEASLQKLVSKHSIPEIMATAVGLPGRVRSLFNRIDKLEKQGKNYIDLLDEIRPIITKYLAHRMDVVVYGVLLLQREVKKYVDPNKVKNLTDMPQEAFTPELVGVMEHIRRIMTATAEADALMMLRAEYFLIGLTVQFCRNISSIEWPPHPSMAMLYELIDMGNEDAPTRQQRISIATKALREMGVELP